MGYVTNISSCFKIQYKENTRFLYKFSFNFLKPICGLKLSFFVFEIKRKFGTYIITKLAKLAVTESQRIYT